MVHFLVYVSTATRLMSPVEMRGLLGECRARNTALGITGALLYRYGTFMQLLEGPTSSVGQVYDLIQHDPRHYGLEILLDGDTQAHQFHDWSMAYTDLTGDTGELGEGFSDFMLKRDEPFGDRPTAAQRLLLSFRRTLMTAG